MNTEPRRIKVDLESFREKEAASENIPPGDFTSPGNPLVEGDTAYPVYVDPDGNVKHATPETAIEEKVTPDLGSISTHQIHLNRNPKS